MTWPSSCLRQTQDYSPNWRRHLRFTWGDPTAFGTPAYWIAQYLLRFGDGRPSGLAIGNSLAEETVACLLGGFGVSAEMGLTAFEALKHSGLIRSPASIEEIEDVLRSPLPYGAGRRRYRFPHQRASRIAAALDLLRQ